MKARENSFRKEAAEEINFRRWQILQAALRQQRIETALQVFRQAGIEPILIKGWAIARFYPEPSQRFSADIDFVVRPQDYEKARTLFDKLAGNGILIDLHNGLRHLDVLPYDDLFINSELLKFNKSEIRVLRHEDHLRVLCVHWLIDGGANKEKLWDIYYGIANRPANFDWDRFLNATGATRRKWFVCTIALAHRFLNLDVSDSPIVGEVDDLPHWFTKTIEKEWKDETELMPLAQFWSKPQMLFKQLRKRSPPNAIHASVMCEAAFDAKPRFPYQIRNIFDRLVPSAKNVIKTLFRKK